MQVRCGEADAIEYLIETAAATFIRRIHSHLGGDALPRCDTGCQGDQWRDLVRSFGIRPGALYGGPRRFRSRLLYVPRSGEWVLQLNGDAPCREKAHYALHELAEFLGAGDFPSDHHEILADFGGAVAYNYTGYPDPSCIRHRVARRIEEMLLPDAPSEAPPIIQPEILDLFHAQIAVLGQHPGVLGLFQAQIDLLGRQMDVIEGRRLRTDGRDEEPGTPDLEIAT